MWFTSLSRKYFNLDPGADKVLTTIKDPGNGGNNENNAEGGNTVVYSSVSMKC